MGCQHFKNTRCMLDPKFHKPSQAEIASFCDTENYSDCPVVNKFSGLECMSCS
ncbi:hypothetical protein METP2_02077 [Methanosarcinales archaeon]|uniref:hypothetical protein n=1 Tax=Candidatus Methanoperedens sp. BLZ2 TaxID=2035255 RepID=UPI0015968D45|nr:hypothetical protein [Candidatus Methanoperedens sp. BLZ2]MBZ0175694.1 hypothetical protein [Candidatus Methanoperedens nitroreducens]MCX9086422.1 hypothetical protein [Candidatus Methanoperedens sp.]CAG0982751.1 hypothetical protein METP2_02077 [Methanosarcinales archaeon]